MRRKVVVLVAVILALGFVVGLTSCTPYDKRPKASINTDNALEDKYIIKEKEYTIATYGESVIIKPTVSQFNNISRQKTLNARLSAFNEALDRNPEKDRNEQLYNKYEIFQMNHYLFSAQYFTAFETTTSNKGVNMIIGSQIDGTLLMNFPALLGNKLESDGWRDFFILFDEAREAAGAKAIDIEYMLSDNISYVFKGEDLTDLEFLIMYKTADSTEQQEVSMSLNSIKSTFLEKIQIFLSFTDDASMTYEEYAVNINEYRERIAAE